MTSKEGIAEYPQMNSKLVIVEDGKTHVREMDKRFKADVVFTNAANIVSFSDCSGLELDYVEYDGVRYTYDGWEPYNEVSFTSEDGKWHWSGCFPQWAH